MIDSLIKLHNLLDRRERLRWFFLLGVVLVMGLLETAGVGSVVPFVAVLTSPGVVESNRYLSTAYNWLGFTNPGEFLFFLGLVMFGVVIGNTAFKAFTSWLSLRLSQTAKYSLSRRLFQRYLHHRYEWFLGKHSSDLGRAILSEVNEVVGGVLTPAMKLITQTVVAVLLIGLLVFVDPLLTIIVSAFVGGVYGLIFWASRRYVSRIGADRLKANRERFRVCIEALGGIKDVKILGLEDTFLRRFKEPSKRLARYAAMSQVIMLGPQFALQAIAVSTVMLIILYQLHIQGSLSQSLPMIALYALAGQRLLPAFQQIYTNISSLRFNKPALELLYGDLDAPSESPVEEGEIALNGGIPHLQHSLELRDICYSYPSASSPALHNVSLMIPSRTTVGLVGQTGAGKTTTVDLILGLLEPQAGKLLVDNAPLTRQNRRSWQRCIGYVPQQIFLSDDTVAANIAFGVAHGDIDMDAVEQAARIANLHKFVTDEMPHGYQTQIGERGVRLSGGQRQRIGIARALYRDPEVVVMDEATSALDNITERAVMDAVRNINRRKTIILIAHRLTTVQRCDTIFLLEGGRVIASGTYDELVDRSEGFRAMVESAVA